MEYDVFISCKSEDYLRARAVYDYLTRKKLKVFLADKELRKKGSAEFGRVIDEALDSAKHLIVFSSNPDYVKSSYVESEWRTFIEEKRSGRKKGNVITILDNCDISSLPITLRHFQSFGLSDFAHIIDFLPRIEEPQAFQSDSFIKYSYTANEKSSRKTKYSYTSKGKRSSKKKIIGIDLGTVNSCVAVFEGGEPVVVSNSEGERTTPSVVCVSENGEYKVGGPAKRQAVLNPQNTVFSIKRLMGETYEQASKEIARMPNRVVNINGSPEICLANWQYTPQEISALILQKMKKAAEDYLGEEVTEAVITVPAYFSNSQRQATKEAGQMAGLNVRSVLNEPTAAAIAYGVERMGKDMKIAVFDLGGGTFDISILEFGGGVFEVLSANGNTHLGGDDFDQVIIDWLVNGFKADEGIDLSKDPMAMQRLKEAAEKAKIELSSTTSTEINLPYITAEGGVPKHLVKTLTRSQFEQLAHELIQNCLVPCQNAIRDAKLSTSDIDEVILVGGSSRIPAVQTLVKNYFGKEPSKGVNPDEVVAVGAAIQGAILNKESGVGDIVLLDVTPLTLGIETMGGVMTKLIEANTTIPCKKSEVFSTAADNQTELTIHVLQGERPMAAQNKSIGQFNLTGIAPARRGVPQIEVTFDIDANGILNVSAKDKATGKEQSIRIEASSGLSDDEIKRMKAEAEQNAENDKKERERIDKLNQADSMIFTTENFLKDNGDKIPADQKPAIEEALSKLKDAHKSGDVAAIDTAINNLNTIMQAASQQMYQQAGPQQAGPQPGAGQQAGQQGGQNTDDNIQDADFEEVK